MNLTPATSDNVWITAWEKNLEEQGFYNNMVKEMFNAIARMIGWFTIQMVLYQNQNLIP